MLSQTRMFYRSMTPVEQEHIVNAYSFELGKVYEQAIKERQLLSLANIDADLCQQVATALGLPTPDPTVDVPDTEPSPALSQVGGEWPADGRLVGIVIDPSADLEEVEVARRTLLAAGALPLVIGPHGGEVDGTVVQRTFATVRSIELDAVLVAGAAPPAPDAIPMRDSKVGEQVGGLDPRVVLLLDECYRHAKVIGAWGDGATALAALGLEGVTGVVSGADAAETLAEVQQLMAGHRVWERFGAA